MGPPNVVCDVSLPACWATHLQRSAYQAADTPSLSPPQGDVCRIVDKKGPEVSEAPPVAAVCPAESISQLLGSSLLGQGGVTVPTASIAGPNKVIALYFRCGGGNGRREG